MEEDEHHYDDNFNLAGHAIEYGAKNPAAGGEPVLGQPGGLRQEAMDLAPVTRNQDFDDDHDFIPHNSTTPGEFNTAP